MDWTSTYLGDPSQEEKNDYKRGGKRNNKGEANRGETSEKAPQILPRTKSSLLNAAHEGYCAGHCSYIKTKLFGPLSTKFIVSGSLV